MPESSDDVDEAELCDTMLEIITRRNVPGRSVSLGFRLRRFRRKKNGASIVSRIAIFEIATSSMYAPSEDSSEIPFDPSHTQFEIVRLRKPPFDSVPHLMRPLRDTRKSSANFFHVPAITLPNSYVPVT